MTLSSTARQIIFWLLIVAGALLLYKLVNPGSKNSTAIDLGTLTQKIDAGEIKQITLNQNEAVALDSRGQELRIKLTSDQIKNTLYNKSQEKNSDGAPKVAKFEDDSGSSSYIWPMLITWAPLLFIIGIWVFMLRQMQSGGNKALSFGKSRAKLSKQSTEARDVQGRCRRRRSQGRTPGDY